MSSSSPTTGQRDPQAGWNGADGALINFSRIQRIWNLDYAQPQSHMVILDSVAGQTTTQRGNTLVINDNSI